MKALSHLSTALIIASAIVLVGNILNNGLTTIATATMGFTASASSPLETLLYFLSAIFFLSGIAMALVSIVWEIKRKKSVRSVCNEG